MEIKSDPFIEKHVIDITAFTPNGNSPVLTLLPGDTYEELADRIEITFHSPWADLPANKMVLYKAHLVGFSVQHRVQRYLTESKPTAAPASPATQNMAQNASE